LGNGPGFVPQLCYGVVNDCNRSGDLKVYFVEFPQQDGSTGYGEDWHPSIATHQLMAERLTAEIKTSLDGKGF